MNKRNQGFYCSFCGRPKEQVGILIAGSEAHICESCTSQAMGIVEQELGEQALPERKKK